MTSLAIPEEHFISPVLKANQFHEVQLLKLGCYALSFGSYRVFKKA